MSPGTAQTRAFFKLRKENQRLRAAGFRAVGQTIERDRLRRRWKRVAIASGASGPALFLAALALAHVAHGCS